MMPSVVDVDCWVADAFEQPSAITSVRTSALLPAAAAAFLERGFREVDRLALLELELSDAPRNRFARTPHRSPTSIAKMRARDLDIAAAIDSLAFDHPWANTAASLDQIARATPHSLQRMAIDREGPPSGEHGQHVREVATPTGRRTECVAGFSITGRAGTTGYLQRLAVHPAYRRRGFASHLVDDAGQWLTRRGATRMLVNTGVDNTAALRLYERLGFARLDDELVVLDRHRDT
jgi:ribosomal protein S18 acetylase RimI-like enzyme